MEVVIQGGMRSVNLLVGVHRRNVGSRRRSKPLSWSLGGQWSVCEEESTEEKSALNSVKQAELSGEILH